ncbi:MAG: xanthine dehydrogenase family protein molybdopterin-binding subunit [Alphaproteobacteria bacterium]
MKYGFGQSVRRSEDPRLLMGRGRFMDDIVLPRMAAAVVLRSPHAHAEIRGIDAEAARGMPGVLAVLTAAELAADGLGPITAHDAIENSDGSTAFTPGRPLLAERRVRFVGEPVALIVAETEAEARDAAEAITVDYDALPAVGHAADAMRDGAPLIWPEAPRNRAVEWEAGDRAATERAFAAAAGSVRIALVNNRVNGTPMEPLAAIGDYDPGEGRYTLYAQSQGVHGPRETLARDVLKVEERKLRVVTPDVGGAFGLRAAAFTEHGLLLWAARRVGRPVKWCATRAETMLADPHARDHVTEAELAFDAEGRFLAVRVHTIGNLGAYPSMHGRLVLTDGYAIGITGLYTVPAFHVRVDVVFTNTMATEAYRGAGRPEAIYVIERLADAAAAELGLAKDEIRRRNLIPASAMPYRTASGQVYDSGQFEHNMTEALKAADAAGFESRRAAARARGRLLGLGLTTYVKINGGMPSEMAELRFERGGGVAVIIGTQTNGQGHATSFAQMVAGQLGVPFESVTLIQGDSDHVPYGKGTGGSSALSVGGSALTGAIDKVIRSGQKIAAHLLEAAEADVRFADGRYAIAGTDRAVSMGEVAAASFRAGPWSAEIGFGLAERALYLPRGKTFANGCHVVEVEVDPETGQIQLQRYTIVDDMGRILNPMLVLGQIHGGLAQGLGQALFESCAYERETGQFLSATFMDYCLPRAADIPEIAIAFNEVPCTTNPLGVKGVGEAGTTGAMPAIVSAVVDALRDFGIRHLDMPLTPERIWQVTRGKV